MIEDIEQWQQGSLLMTRNVMKWGQKDIARAQHDESCRAYIGFSSLDEGRSRTLVCIFNSPEECAKYVNEHNHMIRNIVALEKEIERLTKDAK